MYNKCPESSETSCMKLSTVYLHSGAKDFLCNSSCMNVLLPMFLGVFGAIVESNECCRVVSSRPSGWPDCPHIDGLSMLVTIVGIIKNCQVTNLENMRHAAIQWFDVLTGILWRIMSYAVAHFRVGGTTFLAPTTLGDDVEYCWVNVAAHLVAILVYNLKQNWPAVPCLSALHSVSELFRTLVVLYTYSKS